MDHLYQCNHILNRCLRENAVSEVENVTRTSTRLIHDSFRLCSNDILVCKQYDRIKIPHNRHVVTHMLPALVQPDTPVESDYIAACFAHQLEQRCCAGAKMNYRNAWNNISNHASRM